MLQLLTSRDHLWWYKTSRLYVPSVKSIKARILQEAHDSPIAGHLGAAKTTELVARNYYWPNMHREIADYVTTCLRCQQNKPSHEHPQGLLQPIPTPERRWQQVSMDFITQLPKTKQGHDAIVVFVDKLSKMMHAVPTRTDIDAVEVARIMYREVVRLHGEPESIISDRDSKFTSNFWRELWRLKGTKLAMSTSYHPESDGQTERANRTLEDMLRAFVNARQDNWDEWLTSAEIAINNSQQSSTKFSPYFMNYGFHPRFTLNASAASMNQSAEQMHETIHATVKQAKLNLEQAQQRQAHFANQHRKEAEFEVDDEVMLSTKNLPIKDRAPKLDPKFIGPYRIVKRVGQVAYELALPSTMRSLHPVFHVSKLRKPKESNIEWPDRVEENRPPPEIVDGEEEFEVEAVLDKRQRPWTDPRQRGGKAKMYWQYLVKWKGYPMHERTWEWASELGGAKQIIDEFEQRERDKASAASSSTQQAPRRGTRGRVPPKED